MSLLVRCLSRQDLIQAATHGQIQVFVQSEWTNKYLAVYNAEARNHASADSVQWQRKGVSLHIVQSQGPMERTLTDIVALAKVLYQEEQKAFHAAMAESADRCGKTASRLYMSAHTNCKGGFRGTACGMHTLHCMLQIICSIITAFTVASWETIKNMPRC